MNQTMVPPDLGPGDEGTPEECFCLSPHPSLPGTGRTLAFRLEAGRRKWPWARGESSSSKVGTSL